MLMLKSQTAWVELKPHVHRETAWSALGRGKRKADGAGTGCKGEGGLEGGGGGGGVWLSGVSGWRNVMYTMKSQLA